MLCTIFTIIECTFVQLRLNTNLCIYSVVYQFRINYIPGISLKWENEKWKPLWKCTFACWFFQILFLFSLCFSWLCKARVDSVIVYFMMMTNADTTLSVVIFQHSKSIAFSVPLPRFRSLCIRFTAPLTFKHLNNAREVLVKKLQAWHCLYILYKFRNLSSENGKFLSKF